MCPDPKITEFRFLHHFCLDLVSSFCGDLDLGVGVVILELKRSLCVSLCWKCWEVLRVYVFTFLDTAFGDIFPISVSHTSLKVAYLLALIQNM